MRLLARSGSVMSFHVYGKGVKIRWKITAFGERVNKDTTPSLS